MDFCDEELRDYFEFIFADEVDPKYFLCVICNRTLLDPMFTTCCKMHVCKSCFSIVGRAIIAEEMSVTYMPCCQKDAEEILGDEDFMSMLKEPSVFFLNKLNQKTYKCPEPSCEV